MFAISAAAAVILLGLASVSSAGADQILEVHRRVELRIEGRVEQTNEDRGWIYLGDERARFDQGDSHSWILQANRQRLLFLRHNDRTYLELRLPIRLEDYISVEERAELEHAEPFLVAELSIERSGETRQVQSWEAEKVRLVGFLARDSTRYEHELWVSKDLLSDRLSLYRQLVRNQGEIDFLSRKLARDIAALEGFPVLRSTRVINGRGEEHFEMRSLVSVTERPVAAERYALPPGYTRIDYDLREWVRLPELAEGTQPVVEPVAESSP